MSEKEKVEKPLYEYEKELSIEDRFDKLKKSHFSKIKDFSEIISIFKRKKAKVFSETKRLLLVRPKVPGDGYTKLVYSWAEEIKQKASDEGWQVKDLAENEASRKRIEQEMNDFNPSLVIHYGHGYYFSLWGQVDDKNKRIIDETNIGQAAGMIISTVSCSSAAGLSWEAIGEGVKSYIGYSELYGIDSNRSTDFCKAANAANFSLLEGKTTKDAFDDAWLAYDELITEMIEKKDDWAAIWAIHNRNSIKLLGDPDACV